MGDAVRRFDVDADRSYTCAAAVTGGQLVERRVGTDLVGPAAANSVHVVGVAKFDVPATRAVVGGPQVGDGHELTVMRGSVQVVFAAAANEGDKLIAAANGQVTPAGAAPDARMVVGEAEQAVALGATGWARIY